MSEAMQALGFARLRNEIFTSLADMNEAIAKLTERLNNKPLSKIKKSRNELFETLDRPNALALPSQRYEFADGKTDEGAH